MPEIIPSQFTNDPPHIYQNHQGKTIPLYTNRLHSRHGVLINLLKPNGYVMHQQVKYLRILHSAHNLFMCFIFISEQMATFAPYNKT